MSRSAADFELDALARAAIVEAGVAPGASLAVGVLGAFPGPREAAGAAGTHSATRRTPVHPGTPFDLASVTKPVVACAIMRLCRAGAVRLSDPLGRLIPELAGTPSESVTLELLLSHRAGLEAHVALYAGGGPSARLSPVEALAAAARARRPDCDGPAPETGFPPVYSDLGYILAGAAASRVTGVDLAQVVDREVLAPLGLELELGSARALRERRPGFTDDVAPTEVVASRGGEVRGVVHDENAWALTGDALSGHAGLFGTARGVVRFGAAVLEALEGRRPDWLTPAEVGVLTRERPGGTLRAGFDGKSGDGSSAGAQFGSRSFGHLGFTGTSLWCDPAAGLAAALLTNRVNPTRDNLAIRGARPGVHDALHRLGLESLRARA